MKLLVMGAGGTLGQAVQASARILGYDATGLTRQECDIASAGDVRAAIGRAGPDVVINCAGALPDRPVAELAVANAAGPHVLAAECGAAGVRLLHVSTDCVFSGMPFARYRRNSYRSTDTPDATEPYGRSKAYGEPAGDHVLVVRTSFIGLGRYGLLRHLLDAERDGHAVRGWRHSYWTGSSVHAVADALVAIAAGPVCGRPLHLATVRAWNKADVCRALIAGLGLRRVAFTEVDEPWIDRTLTPDVTMWGLDSESSLDQLRTEVEAWRAASR